MDIKTKTKTRSKRVINGKTKITNKNNSNNNNEQCNGIVTDKEKCDAKTNGKSVTKNSDKSSEMNLNNHLITEYFTASRRRITAKTLAQQIDSTIRHYIVNDCDPIEHLIVEDFEGKGKGVIAAKNLPKGAFVCEYRGDLINTKEAKLRDREYESEGAGCYMYYFNWGNTVWCVDATKPTGRIGRLINHSRKSPNCKTKLFIHNGKPHLIFIAMRDIQTNEELVYDYGERNKVAIDAHPWLRTT